MDRATRKLAQRATSARNDCVGFVARSVERVGRLVPQRGRAQPGVAQSRTA